MLLSSLFFSSSSFFSSSKRAIIVEEVITSAGEADADDTGPAAPDGCKLASTVTLATGATGGAAIDPVGGTIVVEVITAAGGKAEAGADAPGGCKLGSTATVAKSAEGRVRPPKFSSKLFSSAAAKRATVLLHCSLSVKQGFPFPQQVTQRTNLIYINNNN